MTRADRLRVFVDALGPVVWGESDCCAAWANWIAAERNMPVTLPRYSSREEADALIRAAGGLVPLIERVLAPLRLAVTSEPVLGDVGVIRLSDREIGAIFATGGIALWRNDLPGGIDGGRGYVMLQRVNIVKAWSI